MKRCVDRLSYPVTGVCELMYHLCSPTHAFIELLFVGTSFLPNIYSGTGIFCSVDPSQTLTLACKSVLVLDALCSCVGVIYGHL